MKIELDELLSYGVDLKNRKIYFGLPLDASSEDSGDFLQSSVELAIRALHKLASDAPGKPIELHMNSYGGSPYDMLRLYDEIHACPCQIKFFGGGAIMSSATWIMAGCDERYLHPNTTIMIHDGWEEGVDQNHTDKKISVKEAQRLQQRLNKIYAENSRMPEDFWADIVQRDVFMTAEEAIMLGLADKLVEYKKRGNLRKSRQAALKKEPDPKQFKKLIKDIYTRIERIKVPHIELNEPKQEETDPKIVIDDTPLPEKAMAPFPEPSKTIESEDK